MTYSIQEENHSVEDHSRWKPQVNKFSSNKSQRHPRKNNQLYKYHQRNMSVKSLKSDSNCDKYSVHDIRQTKEKHVKRQPMSDLNTCSMQQNKAKPLQDITTTAKKISKDGETEEFHYRKHKIDSFTGSDTTSTESDGLLITVSRTKSTSEIENQQSSDNDNINFNLLTTGTESALSTEEYTSESGCENENPEELTPELSRSIVECLEEYFSDESLSKDLFLLKHVKRRRDGFVSLKLMSGYKKIKKLTKSWRIVSMAINTSDVLEVDNTGKKVRRRQPLPDALKFDVPTSRTILATNLISELTSIEKLASVFGAFGTVTSLQVVRPRPGGNVPPILHSVVERLPNITQHPCAIIEYEDVWGAGQALRDFNKPEVTLHVIKHPRRRQPSNTSACSTPRSPRQQLKINSPSKLLTKYEPGSNRLDSSGSEEEGAVSENGERSNSRLSWRINDGWTTSPVKKLNKSNHSTPTHSSANTKNQYNKYVIRSPRGPDGTIGFANKR